MKITGIYNLAAELSTGFQVEQLLSRRGFYEIGRRTNAAAWTAPDVDHVIRISEDAKGSEAFFSLAQKMQGNPYMPVVLDQKTLKSGDHIAFVEKLESAGHKATFQKFKPIDTAIKAGEYVSVADREFHEETTYMGIMSSTISNFFMRKGDTFDFNKLPDPAAFKEAAIAMLKLAEDVHRDDRRYVPGPDMNPTNVMWRRIGASLQPVLYDPLIQQHDNGKAEVAHTNDVRAKLGMQPMAF